MSVANFELDITSRITDGVDAIESPLGLVWQPTITLWQRYESAETSKEFSATGSSGQSHTDGQVEQYLIEPGETPVTASVNSPSQALLQSHSTGQLTTSWHDILTGNGSLAATCGGYALFLLGIETLLSKPAWENWASISILFVGVFAALMALYLGGAKILLRAVWRATLRSTAEGVPAIWCGLTRCASIMLLFTGLQVVILTSSPRLIELINIARGIIPTGGYQLELVRGGTELAVDGAIGIGLSDNVAQVLDHHPLVQALQLNSFGGSAREARKLRDLIAARKLSTTTARGCDGECTLAYVAGAQRRLGDLATLRFFRSAQPGMPEWAQWREFELDRRDWLARGIPIFFANQALSAPESAEWQPSMTELIAANFVSPSIEMLAAEGEASAPDPLASLDHELRRAPIFTLLNEQEPESYRKLLGDIHSALKSVNTLDSFRWRIHPMAKAMAYERLSRAEDNLLLEYAAMILEQISLLYVESGEVCNRYFGMDLSGAALDMTRYFPEEMLNRETALMGDVLRSSATLEFRPPPHQAIEARWHRIMTRITNRYGAKAALLFENRQAFRDPDQTCHVLYEFYNSVTRLPAKEAGPLLRYHFAQLQSRSLPPSAPPNTTKRVAIHSPPGANIRRAPH